ncbi:transglycosylase SLT domain-containing protein [Actibacterium ureilyticum]|uniref:transglycosylase SLT domain-containing protein n=1 Tax=Actibacterium ureilyticum TaxID=1590614 RepID=UPI000BAA9D84|nr:transglycosylase SLT domain-containing protein [Actibacterium ureilyticum]
MRSARSHRLALCLIGGLLLSACGQEQAVALESRREQPVMRWDHKPQAELWTRASMRALSTHGAVLAQTVPADINAWCPGYANAEPADRRAFWTGLLSALAKHESTWNPQAVGGGGRWFGLVQISPATARGYGCQARTGEDLQKGPANLSCAIRIWSRTVTRDGVVARGGGGVAADWGPFAVASKRKEMAGWTRKQPYCQ